MGEQIEDTARLVATLQGGCGAVAVAVELLPFDQTKQSPDIAAMSSPYPDNHKLRAAAVKGARERRIPGQGAGQWALAEDFDARLPPDVLRAFEGG